MRLPFVPLLLLLPSACSSSYEVGRFDASGGSGGSNTGGAAGAVIALAPFVSRLALGSQSSCVLDGTDVRCFGGNQVGELGVGDENLGSSTQPLLVGNLNGGARAVFAGAVAHCALMSDRRAWCWGDSVFGQYRGLGSVHAIAFAPLEAPGLSTLAQLALGTYFHCALDANGGVACYGLNSAGQLGNGSLQDEFAPAKVIGLGPARYVSASMAGFFACAVLADRSVSCWGANDRGQLGNGSTVDASLPVAVLGLSFEASAVAAGRQHACAMGEGKIACWGANDRGQLGVGVGADRTTAVEVVGVPGPASIAAGRVHTCARTDAGTIYCWGSTDSGSSPTGPKQVVDGGAVEVAAGGGHSCALLQGDVLRCWGDGSTGQLGLYAGAGAPL